MIRALEPRDTERCMDLAERVGWPREPAKWSMLFALGPGYGTDAEDEGLSAMVMMPKLGGLTFVAMMVVAPEVRGRGLGRRLLEHALASARAPVGLYATEMGRPLYERLGFVEVDRVSKHMGPLDRAVHDLAKAAARWRGTSRSRFRPLVEV